MSILDLFGEPTKQEPVVSHVQVDEFTKHASAAFDYEFDGTISFEPWAVPQDLPETFTIGAIVGPSGTGKSLFLNNFGKPVAHTWDRGKAIVSHFKTPEEGLQRLSAVGLNSIPAWMKPYHVLSVGESFRADLARSMGDGAVFDEFTSVVDRETAKSCSRSLKRIATNKGWTNIVVATCHEDILPWLQPDWVFDTVNGSLTVGRWLHRPTIELDVHRCRHDVWPLFASAHYLTAEISKSSHCYVGLWENAPVVFGSVLCFPHAVVKGGWREHRTVVLPQYQGMGIGPRFSEMLGEIYLERGGRFFSRTAHPRLGLYREASTKWRATSHSYQLRTDQKDRPEEEFFHNWKHDTNRVCWAHEYLGSTESSEDQERLDQHADQKQT